MILDPLPTQVVLHGTKICRTKKHDLIIRPDKKTYRIVYTKRKRVANSDTLPFGFKRVIAITYILYS